MMKRRDFIRIAVAIAAVPSVEAMPINKPDRPGIKWENTWALWGDKLIEPGNRIGECFAWGTKVSKEATDI
jgi:hypothetical protein